MNFRKDYSFLIFLYLVVTLNVILGSNKFVTILLLFSIFVITIYIYENIKKIISEDKDASMSSLLNKLDRTQKETEESYKKFLSLSKTLGSGVFMVDYDGKITFSNKDVENYFGIDIANKEYKEIIAIEPLYKFVNQAYLIEEYTRKQIIFEERYFDLISTPLYEGDMFAGILVLVHDITSLKNAEKFQKRFTADVSHELRTPLSAIKGFSEIMMRDKDMSLENRNEFLGLMNKESERMEIILSDLMVISKMDRLDYELNLVNQEIKGIILEAINVLNPKFTDKSLEKIVDIESCELFIDKVKITQVLLNIVKNAINYTDNGYVKIKGYVDKKQYIIEVSDSGIGIQKEKLEMIFKRFYRIDKARSRDTGGSGLGLSISKNVVMKHGGSISVHSVENEGSTFSFTLPIKE